jgi:peptidoglycan hydrolase CwlO-like protein
MCDGTVGNPLYYTELRTEWVHGNISTLGISILNHHRGYRLAKKTRKIGEVATGLWQVRDENGAIFGPVDFSALKSWVADGRVSPVSEVSSDGEEWVLAVLVNDFEMNCVADIEPGSFYGPIHRKAMRELIAAGSISADAKVYCKDSKIEAASQPHSVEGVDQGEYDAVCVQLAAVKADKDAVDSELKSDKASIATLQGEAANDKALMKSLQDGIANDKACIETLQGEIAEDKVHIDALQGEITIGQNLFGSLQGEVAKENERIESLQGEIVVYKKEISELQSALDEITGKYQMEISSLNEVNNGLKSQVDALVGEQSDFRVEIEALRKNNHDQIKLIEERDRLYAAELNEKETASNLKIESMVLEHESLINRIKHQSIEEIHSLQASNLCLQESAKSLNNEVKELQDASLALEDEKRKMAAAVQKSGQYSLKEHEIHADVIAVKDREISQLVQRIGELEQSNQGLKEEFVKYEELKTRNGSNDVAKRKLVVIKNLFAEAALLLEEEEDGSVEAEGESGSSDRAGDVIEPELLDYEELPVEELKAKKNPPVVVKDTVKEKKVSRSVPKKAKESKANGEKKWPFGKGKKSFSQDSLAELEAQAQMELQRISSSRDISAIFEKKK